MKSTKSTIQKGKQAETIAIQYFNHQGFVKQAQNYRFQKAEIDLIVQKKDLLLFIEIKSRNTTKFGYAETFCKPKQQGLYQIAASQYIQNTAWQGQVRFDIIAIHHHNKKIDLAHFQDAFY
ncbi:MAG: YraN family protein [Bacteroidota bacterium]